mmetsp:Transcript_8943/g.24667  ORF Transcript_8943/g.24667 Transcript_8943/m.24667 type:complete len:263 (+) Transcript_8943:2-790(+)
MLSTRLGSRAWIPRACPRPWRRHRCTPWRPCLSSTTTASSPTGCRFARTASPVARSLPRGRAGVEEAPPPSARMRRWWPWTPPPPCGKELSAPPPWVAPASAKSLPAATTWRRLARAPGPARTCPRAVPQAELCRARWRWTRRRRQLMPSSQWHRPRGASLRMRASRTFSRGAVNRACACPSQSHGALVQRASHERRPGPRGGPGAFAPRAALHRSPLPSPLRNLVGTIRTCDIRRGPRSIRMTVHVDLGTHPRSYLLKTVD